MIDVGQVKKGITIELDNQLYQVIDFQHIKVGRGSAQIRLKLRNVRNGHTTERSFQASEKFIKADLERHLVQYHYNDRSLYYFMDVETFEQMTMDEISLKDFLGYLTEGLNIEMFVYKGKALSVELPPAVELKVTDTGPGFKGNTASSGSKPAIVETGITIQVPFFINIGDSIKVDTRNGEYLERVS